MKKEIFCSVCGRKFIPVGREHICPSCKQEAAAAAKKAAVERAKARSYAGEACPVRISAKARGFIEAVAAQQESKFIPALDAVLQAVCKQYGFNSWDAVPEHKTARRDKHTATETPQEAAGKPQEAQAGKQAAKVAATTPATPATSKEQAAKVTSKTTTAKKSVKTSTTAGKKVKA